MEIYKETVRDLLTNGPADKLDIKLNQEGNLHVPGGDRRLNSIDCLSPI